MAAVVPYEEAVDKAMERFLGQPYEAIRRNMIAEAIAGLAGPGALGAQVTRRAAAGQIAKGFKQKLTPLLGKKRALKAARPHVRAVGKLPQKYLDPVRQVRVEDLPSTAKAQHQVFSQAGGDPSKIVARDIILDPVKASPESFYHELGHNIQYTAEEPIFKKMLKPVHEELATAGKVPYKSVTEAHARDFASRVIKMLEKYGPGRRLSEKEVDMMAKKALEAALKQGGWVP